MIDDRLHDLGWFEFQQLIQALAKAWLGFGIETWPKSSPRERPKPILRDLRLIKKAYWLFLNSVALRLSHRIVVGRQDWSA